MQYASYLLALFVLAPIPALAQTTPFDGSWTGKLSCGPNLSTTARSRNPYTVGLRVDVVQGVVRGVRETPETLEKVTGSVGPNGDVFMFIDGHWKDNTSQTWRTRLSGKVRGQQLLVLGDMGSMDGKAKFRECSLALGSDQAPAAQAAPAPAPAPAPAAPAATAPPPTSTVRKQPAPAPAAAPAERKPVPAPAATAAAEKAAAEKAASDKAAADRAAAEKTAAEKRAAEKLAAERAAAERIAAENAAAEKAAAARAAADKAAADKAAADKALAEKKAAEGRRAPVKAPSSIDL